MKLNRIIISHLKAAAIFLLVFGSIPVIAQTVMTQQQLLNLNNSSIVNGVIPSQLNALLGNMIVSSGAPYNASNTPQFYGAKCDGTTDDSTALTAWAASITFGTVAQISGKCVFKVPLIFPIVDNVTIQGTGVVGSALIYSGNSTAATPIIIGSGVGSCSVNNWKLINFSISSTTTMTGGDGLRINDACVMDISNIMVGGFNNGAADLHLWNAIHIAGGNTIKLRSFVFSSGNTAEIINGDNSLQLSDLQQMQGLIFGSKLGIDIAGNVGGFYADQTDVLENGANVKVTQDQVNVGNLQLFFGPSFVSDVTNSTQFPSASQIGFEVSDPGAGIGLSIITFTGSWVSSSFKQCIKIDSTVTYLTFNFVGGNSLNCGLSSIPANVDIESTAANVAVTFSGTRFSSPTLGAAAPYIFNASTVPVVLNSVEMAHNSNGTVNGVWSGLINDDLGNVTAMSTGTMQMGSNAGNTLVRSGVTNSVILGPGATAGICGIWVTQSGTTLPGKMDGSMGGCAENLGSASFPFTNLYVDNIFIPASVPTISSCGASPPAATAGSNNNAGQFTMGTSSPTACTVTFAGAYPTTAFCTVTPASSGGAAITGGYYISAQSKSAFTLTLGTGTNSLVFNYTCSGN